MATASASLTTSAIAPISLDFSNQGRTTDQPDVTLTNTGGSLAPRTYYRSGDFSETDDCAGSIVSAAARRPLHVMFRPSQAGSRSGQLSVTANMPGVTLCVSLGNRNSRRYTHPGGPRFRPGKGRHHVRGPSVTAENNRGARRSDHKHDRPRAICHCGQLMRNLVAAGRQQLPNQGRVCAYVYGQGHRRVDHRRCGWNAVRATHRDGRGPANRHLSPASLTFARTIIGAKSDPQTLTLKNNGDLLLTSIAATVSGPFELKNDCTAQLGAHSPCCSRSGSCPPRQEPKRVP